MLLSPSTIPPGILIDKHIKQLNEATNMITPFIDHTVRQRDGVSCVSYGLTGVGYDIRLGNNFKVCTRQEAINPKDLKESDYDHYDASVSNNKITIFPNWFVLGASYETVNIPDDILVDVLQKSTLARCGIHVWVTSINPGQEGSIVFEIKNDSKTPFILDTMEGIAHFRFHKLSEVPEDSYRKAGTYRNQQGVVIPTFGG